MTKLIEITLDFETYYSKKEKYSLSARGMTYEKYIRDPRFEIVGLAVKVQDKPSEFLAPHEIEEWLAYIEVTHGWDNIRIIAHNAMFDCAILGWLYQIYPKQIADTMLFSRAAMLWDGNSLDNVTKQLREKYGWCMWYDDTKACCGVLDVPDHYATEDKGEEVHNADGKHLMDFTDEEYDAYANYAMKDVDLTWSAYKWFTEQYQFPATEIDVMTMTLEMFTYPVLQLDKKVLLEVAKDIEESRANSRDKVGLTQEELRKDSVIADKLTEYGVTPPTKLNSKGEKKYAFAKSDNEFLRLLEHDDERVANLVAARLGNKSSQAVTRVQTFIGMSDRGMLPIPIEYYAARTGRFGGGQANNVQNMNRNKLVGSNTKTGQLVFYKGRADRFVDMVGEKVYLAKHGLVDNEEDLLHEVGLRDSFIAPKGKVLVVNDLAQIEARCLNWLAGEQWVLDAFIAKKDLYKATASRSFGVPYEEVTKSQRFTGKAQVLGLGYQAGVNGLKVVLGKKADEFDDETLQMWVNSYRASVPNVVKLWDRGKTALGAMASGVSVSIDDLGLLRTENHTIPFPNGMRLVYRGIEKRQGERGFGEFWYWGKNQTTGKPGWEKTFQGRLIENCIAEDTEVLTDRGWVKIQDVMLTDKVHDGVEFVTHKGILFKSVQTCVNIDGVYMTEDHEVLTNDGWKKAGVLLSKGCTSSIQRLDRATLREISRFTRNTVQKSNPLAFPMRLWKYLSERSERFAESLKKGSDTELRLLYEDNDVRALQYASIKQAPDLRCVAIDEVSVYKPQTQSVEKLWWSWGYRLPTLVGEFREFSGRYVTNLRERFRVRPYRQQQRVLQGELPLGFSYAEYQQSKKLRANNFVGRFASYCGSIFKTLWDRENNYLLSAWSGRENASTSRETRPEKKVYDIVHCGKRHRFVVRGFDGEPFIVHNCIQGLARIILTTQMLQIRDEFAKRGWSRDDAHIAMQVHDEVIVCCKEELAEEILSLMQDIMATPPDWAKGLPLGSDGDIARRYGCAK